MVYVLAITFLGSTRGNHQRPGRIPVSTPLFLFWFAVITVVFVLVVSCHINWWTCRDSNTSPLRELTFLNVDACQAQRVGAP